MQIVTDRGVDLAPKQTAGLKLHFVPLRIELEGKTYLSGVDIMPQEFYRRLEETGAYPLTSQPSPADFATLYRELAKTDPEILSLLTIMIGLIFSKAAIIPFKWLIRPPWIRYFKSARV